MIRVIIPAYNESKNLPRVIPDVSAALKNSEHRIYVVDDGSTDMTAEVLVTLASRYPLTVLTHRPNKGVAAAFRTGFTAVMRDAAEQDVVVLMEGDGTSLPELLPEMAQRIQNGADIVIASRYRQGGGYKNFPLKRLLLSRGANLVFRILFPIPSVTDYSIFYRAYRVPPLRATIAQHGDTFIASETFFANIEILLKLRPYLKRIEEVPLNYDYGLKRGKSGMKVWKNLRSYLRFIARNALC